MNFFGIGKKAIENKGSRLFCEKLADILMIEADGGDDPASVVAWAIEKAEAEVIAERHERWAKESREEADKI